MLQIYGTYPALHGVGDGRRRGTVLDAVRWSEAAGIEGLLVFTDNESIDPWAASQFLLERAATLVPLVAVQPLYMHPYTAARMVASLAALYDRRIDLNLVTGGFRPHMWALGCALPHDDRYRRLTEYGTVLLSLLRDGGPVDFRGDYYETVQAALRTPLPQRLQPRVFVAGTSPAAAAVAREFGAVRLVYPLAPREYEVGQDLGDCGMRVGIIARERSEDAWRIAYQRYPRDSVTERLRAFERPYLDARWSDALWAATDGEPAGAGAYWPYPFRASKEFCPYLVGSYPEVAQVLARYLDTGIRVLILAQPWEEDDLPHAVEAIRCAQRLSGRAGVR